MPKLYDLFDGDKKVLTSVTSARIKEYTGKPRIKVNTYARGGYRISGRYKVAENVATATRSKGLTKSLLVEWQEACDRLRGIPGLDKIIIKQSEK